VVLSAVVRSAVVLSAVALSSVLGRPRKGHEMTRILIADDHDVVRSGVRSILEAQTGWEVVGEAENGKDAVDQALATRPDIVVLDYALPVMNGIEATRQIRARVPGAEVLIFTMHDTATLVREVLEAGAKGFLLKSDARKFLIAAIESLAAHKPFFTGTVSETLLETYLAQGTAAASVLTSREKSVVQLIAEGQTNKRIADVLSISLKTVETHRASALRKLNLATTAALIRYAIRNKLVED
jgi:DNA-binding NarL/FixJ family response regulator